MKNWAVGDWYKFHVIVWYGEEECSETWVASLITGRLDYSVNSWTVVPSGEEFH